MDSQKIYDITTGIYNLFGLEEQGKELVTLVAQAAKCDHICLLFLDDAGENFTVLTCKPVLKKDPFSGLRLDLQNPVVKHLVQDKKPLTGGDLSAIPVLKRLWAEDVGEIGLEEIGLLVPLISHDRMVGIMLLGNKGSGEYTSEDISMAGNIAELVAPGMEKEYLREQLGEREKELSILNRCSAIIASSLDVEGVFESFITELKKLVDVDWTALTLIEGENLYILALYSEIGSNWRAGERLSAKGTATEWVMVSKMPLVEPDLKKESMFVTDVYHRKQGIRSIACLPLLVKKDEAIGSLIVGVRKPDAYSPKQVEFLRELASQIAMPIENARVYAEVLKKSRFDELTGLLNRRTMDEQIVSEINRHSRYGGVFSLIILDLDSMKPINDRYGHLAGDGLLARTGSVITETIRSVDQAFRYGGDEFAVLLPNTPINAAVQVSERVRKQIASRLVVDDMIVTASFGLASWPINGAEANDIVAAADAALYEAKRKGRNQSYYDESLH